MIEKRAYMMSYPVGIRVKGYPLQVGNNGCRGRRSRITGLSASSARRLRDFIMINEVPGSVLLNASLTCPESVSAEFWRSSCLRFRQALKYHKIPGVWRVELQRREVPHLHCFFWIPLEGAALKASGGPEIPPEARLYVRQKQKLIKSLWINSIQTKNAWADKYAVKARVGGVVPDVAWIMYNCLHNAKQAQAQSGWLGKQWGVWCRDMFKPILPVFYDLPDQDLRVLVRYVNKWLKSKHKGKGRKKFCKVSVLGSFSKVGLSAEKTAVLIDWIKAD